MRKIAIGLAAAAIITAGSTLSASAIYGGGGGESAIHGGSRGDGGGGAYFDVARFGGGGYGRGGFRAATAASGAATDVDSTERERRTMASPTGSPARRAGEPVALPSLGHKARLGKSAAPDEQVPSHHVVITGDEVCGGAITRARSVTNGGTARALRRIVDVGG
jgi:hypothetical protein